MTTLGTTLAALGLLVAVLGVLQWRWTDELTRTARASLSASLGDLGRRTAEDLERELARALPVFSSGWLQSGEERERGLIAEMERWERESLHPKMLEELWLVSAEVPCRTARSLRRGETAFVQSACPEWLAHAVEREKRERAASAARGLRRRSAIFDRSPPALLLGNFGPKPGPDGLRPLDNWFALRFSESEISGGLLHALLDQTPNSPTAPAPRAPELEPELAVEGPSGPGPWLGVGGRDRRAAQAPAAVRIPMLRFFPLDELRRRAVETQPEGGIPFPAGLAGRAGGTAPAAVSTVTEHDTGFDSGWSMLVRIPAGPLDAVVARARRRNLALGFGVLSVLGAAAVALASLARRAERLAEERLRFVAGVTHELRSPVASIRSLADNLADGLVGDPARLKTYGSQIRRDAERLGDLVEETLLVGGLRAAVTQKDLEAIALSEAASAALQAVERDCNRAGREGGSETPKVRFEVDLQAEAPIRGRRGAIERAIGNLIENAAKFAGPGATVRVSTREVAREIGPSEAQLVVADDGPGVPPQERKSIFEPFFRGGAAVDGALPGSGLGLAVVRETALALGGRVEVTETRGGGATFILAFPLVTDDDY
jgi:signal transduction histidine kinase